MKHKLLLVLFLFPAILFAQNFRGGALLGLSMNQIDGDTYSGYHKPKRNVEGVIQCRNKADQTNTLFAAQICAVMQDEYNKKRCSPNNTKNNRSNTPVNR